MIHGDPSQTVNPSSSMFLEGLNSTNTTCRLFERVFNYSAVVKAVVTATVRKHTTGFYVSFFFSTLTLKFVRVATWMVRRRRRLPYQIIKAHFLDFF